MSALRAKPATWRATAWTLIAAMLLPTLLACTTAPPGRGSADQPSPRGGAQVARLDGIVVDGNRAVQGREPGWMVVTRDGYRQDGYPGLELRLGDIIETGPRAHAVIRYPSGTEVLMRPSSGGRIGSITDFFGEMFVKVRGVFSVETTFVKAGARGTAYLVRTYAGGTTGVTVVEGAVEVGSTTNAWPSVVIGAGTMTLAHPRRPEPQAASLEELARTRDWVERVEQLVPPPRSGVSTGAVVGAVAIAALIAGIAASRERDRDRDRERDRERERNRPRETPASPRDTPPSRDTSPPRDTPRPLDAPRAIDPGAARYPGPTLDCRRGVTLRWSPVAGARDYLVAMEGQQTSRGWNAVRVPATGATQASVAAASLAYDNRWSARARAATEGPASPWLHFRCDFSGVR